MRISHLIFALVIVIFGFAGVGTSAQARTLSMHKHSAEELQKVCTDVGGRFSQGPNLYGCGTDCNGGPGTDCIVTCNADQNCDAQVIGGRRPHTLESALKK